LIISQEISMPLSHLQLELARLAVGLSAMVLTSWQGAKFVHPSKNADESGAVVVGLVATVAGVTAITLFDAVLRLFGFYGCEFVDAKHVYCPTCKEALCFKKH